MLVSDGVRVRFLIDILACLPINYVTLIAGAQVNCAGAQADCTVDAAGGGAEQRANKFFRLLRLFRLLKLLRLLRMNRLMKKYEEQFYKLAHGLKLMKIAFAVVFCGHWIGCVWYFLGTEEWHDEQEFYPDGTEIRPWVTLQFGKQANESGRGTRCKTAAVVYTCPLCKRLTSYMCACQTLQLSIGLSKR
eukprot:COSAG01_NODE_4191_length_5257_cov_21.106437_4_plen_190_part_00